MPLDRKFHAGRAVLCLSLCFLAGAAAGQALAFGVPDAAAPELRRSLADYYRNRDASQITAPLALSTLVTWFRAPVLVFLWGFTSLGVTLVYLTAAAFGFLLSYSVGCFAASLGWEGVALSAAALGIRAVITMPCFILLSLSSMRRAGWLSRLAAGRRERCPERRVCVALCTLILSAGAALDLYATPRLLCFALDWLAGVP